MNSRLFPPFALIVAVLALVASVAVGSGASGDLSPRPATSLPLRAL